MSTAGLNKHKLAMVDLDGTLVFTLEANALAYARALAEYGFTLTREDYAARCDGRAYRDFLPEIMGADSPYIEAVHDRKIALYGECLTAAEPNGPLLDILRGLKESWILALVTTASRRNVENVLARFGLTELFDVIVTQEDVRRAKPDPACYNDLIERLGVRREDGAVMEGKESALRRLLGQALRFLGLSGIGWLLDFTVYTLLSLRFRDLAWVNVLSSLVGASFVFLFSTRFVFRDSHRIPLRLKYAIYIAYQLVLIFLISKLLAWVHLLIVSHTDRAALVSLAPVLAKILVTPVTMTVNFFAMKTVIEKL